MLRTTALRSLSHHGLAACLVNGFPSSVLIDSYTEKNLENELFEVVVGSFENLMRRVKTFGRVRGGGRQGGEVARMSRVAIASGLTANSLKKRIILILLCKYTSMLYLYLYLYTVACAS